ncbi:MAG: N-acetyltransferase [Desulfobacterales bacterium]|nr:MAG: N-acetyltransferase [Desulfobacterales bacterium]
MAGSGRIRGNSGRFFRDSCQEHTLMIRNMADGDLQAVLDIYKMGIETGNATFETALPAAEKWDQSHHKFCRFVCVENGAVVGWAALSPVSQRPCYSGVAELSIYVSIDHVGQGIGHDLLAHLIPESETNGIWTIHSSIFPENKASHRLLLKFGFREVGRREKIARLSGRWRTTLILERRSKVVGD